MQILNGFKSVWVGWVVGVAEEKLFSKVYSARKPTSQLVPRADRCGVINRRVNDALIFNGGCGLFLSRQQTQIVEVGVTLFCQSNGFNNVRRNRATHGDQTLSTLVCNHPRSIADNADSRLELTELFFGELPRSNVVTKINKQSVSHGYRQALLLWRLGVVIPGVPRGSFFLLVLRDLGLALVVEQRNRIFRSGDDTRTCRSYRQKLVSNLLVFF